MELDNLKDYFNSDIISVFAEINAPRSAYQIEKFVLGQHDTEEMRYYQCVLELHNLHFAIKKTALEVKKIEIEIKNLRATGDEIDEIDAQIKELDLESLRSVAVSAFNEYDILMELYSAFPKYTRQQIDEAQPAYWQLRLTRQYELAGSTATANQAAHLDSLLQIGAVVRELTPLTNEPTKEIQGESK